MLISVIILNFNRTTNSISTSLDFDRFRIEALSILASHVSQLSQYYFDEASTDTTEEARLAHFSLPHQLGFDNGDDGIRDDIDDLHEVTIADTGLSGVIYNVDYVVDYVELIDGIITHSENREYHKRIAFTLSDVLDPPLIYHMSGDEKVRDTLRLEVVISYWFFN